MGLRPKCLICGDDVLRAPALRRLAARLNGLNVMRTLNKVPISLEKSFTGILQRLIDLPQQPAKQVGLIPVPRLCSGLRHI